MGVPRAEAVRRLLPAGAIYFRMDEGDVQRILAFDETMIGSDGLPHDTAPHPRLWGAFPRVLGHYGRGLGLFPLEKAVHKMTGLTARNFGLADRGVLKEGAFADMPTGSPTGRPGKPPRCARRASMPSSSMGGLRGAAVNRSACAVDAWCA
jgi:N-acyl-D-aspartate/D-glutamate deacylase